jgi:hypothetical protein
MMRSIALAVVLVALLGGSPAFGQSKAKAQNVPEISYDSVAGFFKLPPGLYFGEGIDCRSENELFVAELTNWRVQKVTLVPGK